MLGAKVLSVIQRAFTYYMLDKFHDGSVLSILNLQKDAFFIKTDPDGNLTWSKKCDINNGSIKITAITIGPGDDIILCHY